MQIQVSSAFTCQTNSCTLGGSDILQWPLGSSSCSVPCFRDLHNLRVANKPSYHSSDVNSTFQHLQLYKGLPVFQQKFVRIPSSRPSVLLPRTRLHCAVPRVSRAYSGQSRLPRLHSRRLKHRQWIFGLYPCHDSNSDRLLTSLHVRILHWCSKPEARYPSYLVHLRFRSNVLSSGRPRLRLWLLRAPLRES